jgi:hypothetical protein
MDVATFKDEYPEFADVADAIVEAKLRDALAEIDVEKWGDDADRGQGLQAARLLVLSPHGSSAGLRLGAGKTAYDDEYFRLRRMIGTAHRVVP